MNGRLKMKLLQELNNKEDLDNKLPFVLLDLMKNVNNLNNFNQEIINKFFIDTNKKEKYNLLQLKKIKIQKKVNMMKKKKMKNMMKKMMKRKNMMKKSLKMKNMMKKKRILKMTQIIILSMILK